MFVFVRIWVARHDIFSRALISSLASSQRPRALSPQMKYNLGYISPKIFNIIREYLIFAEQ
jgi:hypothetical protein